MEGNKGNKEESLVILSSNLSFLVILYGILVEEAARQRISA